MLSPSQLYMMLLRYDFVMNCLIDALTVSLAMTFRPCCSETTISEVVIRLVSGTVASLGSRFRLKSVNEP